MSSGLEITGDERESIVESVRQTVLPTSEHNASGIWADALIAAFEHSGRTIVFCGAGFRCYSPSAGYFVCLADLEIQAIIFDCKVGKERSLSFVSSVVRTMKARAFKGQAYFDRGRNALTCLDGTLVLDWEHATEVIRVEEQSPAWRTTGGAPIFLQGVNDGDNATLDAFINEVIPDPIAQERLFELVGLALLGEGCRYQCVLLLIGEGANGKGVLCGLLAALFPLQFRSSVSPSEMTVDFGRAKLEDSRLNIIPELDRLKMAELTTFKSIVAGDTINSRRVRENGFDLRPQALHIITTNHLPSLGNRSVAKDRRFVVISCDNVVPPERRDPLLLDRLRATVLPALLWRCVEAAQRAISRLRANDHLFPMSPRMIAAASALFDGQDHVEQFVAETLVATRKVHDRVGATELRNAYEDFCGRNGLRPMGAPVLKARLAELGITSMKAGGIFYVGVQLSSGPEGGQGGGQPTP